MVKSCAFVATVAVVLVACASEVQGPPTPASAPDASTTSAQCLEGGGDCTENVEACCNGFTCVTDVKDQSKSVCAATCLNHSQCESGCCTTLAQGTSAVCAPPKYCAPACVKAGGFCSAATCCADSVCVTSTVDGTRCAAKCTTHGQCASLCCAPLQNTGELVCSPASFCR